jgi:putative SOS response-associated peptidase YedK
MCNEYTVDLVGGVWVHIHRTIGGGGQIVAEVDPDNPEVISPPEEYAAHLKRWTGYPDREMPVAVLGPGGGAKLEIMRWGFPPVRAGERVITNIRNLNSSYWRPWLGPEWRCLVPVTDFCEWTDDPPKRKKWFRLKENTPFMFAGIWRPWNGVRGTKAKPVEGDHKLFAFVTTSPNEIVRYVHAKAQPVILTRKHWRTWLEAPWDIAKELLVTSPADEMEQPTNAPRS